MTDLLSQRIKYAKNELTALKTAHRRGVGNLKVYTHDKILDVSGHETGIWYINVAVTFNTAFAPFPLTTFSSATNSSGDYSCDTVGIDYSGDGYTLNARLFWIYTSGLDSIHIEATTPINNVSIQWSQA